MLFKFSVEGRENEFIWKGEFITFCRAWQKGRSSK